MPIPSSSPHAPKSGAVPVPTGAAPGALPPVREARGWRFLWYRVRRSPLTIIGFVLIVLYALMAILAPVIAPPAPGQTDPLNPPANYAQELLPAPWMGALPGCASAVQQCYCHCYMGTSVAGVDIWYGVVWGSRISMLMGLGVTLVGASVGLILGLIAGWYGGWVDDLLLRITDIFLSLPLLVLAIAVVIAFHSKSLYNVAFALMIVWWPSYTRIVRGQVLTIRETQYIEAARASGLPDWYIMIRHIFPNTLSPVVVQATLDIGTVVLIAAALSFIGFSGTSDLLPEWGRLVALGQGYIVAGLWWTVVFPGLAIFGFVLGFNLLGDGLRDILDPRGAR
ncbi:MAG: ABC transporter permease [Thermoplasmatota archaeon]